MSFSSGTLKQLSLNERIDIIHKYYALRMHQKEIAKELGIKLSSVSCIIK